MSKRIGFLALALLVAIATGWCAYNNWDIIIIDYELQPKLLFWLAIIGLGILAFWAIVMASQSIEDQLDSDPDKRQRKKRRLTKKQRHILMKQRMDKRLRDKLL